MMKKALLIALCGVCLLLTGCGKDQTAALPTDALPAQAAAENTASSISDASVSEIDLTKMSSTMVYSYVFNIINTPDDFIGQRFRMRGTYDEGLWEPTNQTYHYIVIADATSCCAQGMEFTLADKSAAYPQPGDEIEISGILSIYKEEGNMYLQIVADSIQKD